LDKFYNFGDSATILVCQK